MNEASEPIGPDPTETSEPTGAGTSDGPSGSADASNGPSGSADASSEPAREPTEAGGTPEGNGHGPLTEQVVLEALKDVLDPELGVNIVDLGLVYEVSIDDDTVHIQYTLTTMGCPIGPLIEAQMQQLLEGVPGVEHVDAEMVLRPPWSPEMMSEEAKAALGFF